MSSKNLLGYAPLTQPTRLKIIPGNETMNNDKFFEEKSKEIDAEYKRLGHDMGWTFLMSPKKTLSPETEIAIISLNPGGNEPGDGVGCCNESAYLSEQWDNSNEPGKNPFQVQVQKLFEGIYERLNDNMTYKSYEDLMNNTLSSQYIPFRSKNIKSLPKRAESENFSCILWKSIFSECINPRIVIALSVAFFAISKVMEDRDSGYTLYNSEEINTNWGKSKARLKRFKNNDGKICILLGLPHLSRYKLFSAKSEATKRAMKKILDKTVENFNE